MEKNHNFLYNSQICLNIYKLQNILQNNKKLPIKKGNFLHCSKILALYINSNV